MQNVIIKSKYEIKNLISEDLLSYNYLGYIRNSTKPVLIWQYKPEFLSSKLINRLFQLAEKLIIINHPNLLRMLDYYYDGKSFFTIHQFTDNLISLDAYLKSAKKIDSRTLFRINFQVLSAMKELEKHKLVHGNLNLSNIYLNPRLEIIVTNILLPFIILRKNLEKFSIIEESIFLAPEFIHNKEYKISSDVYAFGVLLYFLYTKHWPYKNTPKIIKQKKMLLTPPLDPQSLNKTIPEKLNKIIKICIMRDPEKRFSSFNLLKKAYLGETDIENQMNIDIPAKDKIKIGIEKELQIYRKQNFLFWFKITTVLIFSLCILTLGYLLYNAYFTSISEVVVPNIVGLSQVEAEKILRDYKLRSLVVGSSSHPTVPLGSIIEIQPRAGRNVKQNRIIKLFISKGIRQAVIPNLIGKAYDQAELIMNQEGLGVKVFSKEYAYRYQAGRIINQYPKPNSTLDTGKNVQVIISKGFPVQVDVVPLDLKTTKSNFRSVVISFEIPSSWPAQKIVINFLSGTINECLYSMVHYEGEKEQLHFKMIKDGYVEVYFNDELGLKQQI